MTSNWYASLNALYSRGSTAPRPGSLGALHALRQVHQGQFFTPTALAAVMWSIVQPAMEAILLVRGDGGLVSILDNSVGSGRLLQFADPARHALYGVDVDREAIAAVGEVAKQAGFNCDFVATGMEGTRPHGFNVALINPPFSLRLDAPTLSPYACTTYGKFGPNTSAASHAYALAQALDAAQLVVAVLPASFIADLKARPEEFLDAQSVRRLAAIVDLPRGIFREESTDVSVGLAVFGDGGTAPQYLRMTDLSEVLPTLPLAIYGHGSRPRLNEQNCIDEQPSIVLPVTGDPTVRITHSGRRLVMHYQCGFTQARVQNAVLQNRIVEPDGLSVRKPRGVAYVGQGVLDVEVHLAQPDPFLSFRAFLNRIRDAGGVPVVAPGLENYFRNKLRRHLRQAAPMRHTVWMASGNTTSCETVTGRARHSHVANSSRWVSPLISAGEVLAFKREANGQYAFTCGGELFHIPFEDLIERFDLGEGDGSGAWVTVHEGLRAAYPDIERNLRARAHALGIHRWLDWGFQLDDLIELAMKPYGAVAAWEQGCGKARLAVALILLVGCKHGLIVTEGGAVDELLVELRGLPIDPSCWQVIDAPEKLQQLRTINVIGYERLRMPISRARTRLSYARMLRGRIGVIVPDEGELLANPASDQCRALHTLRAKRRYVLTGTPIANYPRDILPVLNFVAGDATAAQPWGWKGGFLESNWRQDMSYAKRGIDAFRDTFVTLDWVTREFEDTLNSGAKREIPRIQNLQKYRAMLAPHVKRRVMIEPDVAKYIRIPPHSRETVEIPWADAHLAYFLDVADEFASWYRRACEGDRRLNLVAILAHLRAVSFASDYPQHVLEGFGCYAPLTSKQHWALDTIEALTHDGHKTILYAESPGQLELLGRHLAERGIDALVYHGGAAPKKRAKRLRVFREGACPVMLASLGVTQKALNLWQADTEIFLSRSWSARTEEQALRRALRPQQTKNVRVIYAHLRGGIDEYKAQLVAFKKDSADAGLDWATPQTDTAEFLHLTTVINRFVDSLSALRNTTRRDLRDELKQIRGARYA